MAALPLLAILALLFTATNGHGFMGYPPQRGCLDGHFQAPYIEKFPDTKKCHDYSAHFPAGDKDRAPGAGHRSQDRAVKDQGGEWSEFKPLDKNMVWRAGVCGDEYGKKQEHLKDGKYYCEAQIVKTYEQGAVFEVKMSTVAHHNGYMELHICDVAKCGGEISKECFHDGHCQQVLRAENPLCDDGNSKHCGPIDRNKPGRWYMACDDGIGNAAQVFGGQYAKFKLPDDLHCEHCVLQWFHTAASTCNPPGVLEYFDGPDRPMAWGNCKGQGGAKGGVTRVQKPCGPGRTPEEYIQCADIRITPRDGKSQVSPTPTSTPRPSPAGQKPTPSPSSAPKSSQTSPSPTPTSSPKPRQNTGNRGRFVDFILYGKSGSWKQIGVVRDNDVIDISSYSKVAVKVTTSRWVKNVRFYENGRGKWTDWKADFFMYGNGKKGPFGWRNVPVNKEFTLKARSPDGSSYSIQLTLNN